MIKFIDAFSRFVFVWVYFMKDMSEALDKFKEIQVEVERETKYSVCKLRSNNGG